MFVFGHLCTTADSRVFRKVNIQEGEGLLGLMFPDFVACHDWAYQSSWALQPDNITAQLIKAHIIEDAVIHFGPVWSVPNRKQGWAYRKMGILARSYKEFFERAARDGFLLQDDSQPIDSLRGWAHTLIEYSVDQYLTDTRDLGHAFDSIRRVLGNVNQHMSWVEDTFSRLGVQPSKPFPAQPLRYASILASAQAPDEFHLRGLAAKFRLRDSEEVLHWLRQILRHVNQTVGADDMEDIIKLLTTIMQDPIQYSYPIVAEELPWSEYHQAM